MRKIDPQNLICMRYSLGQAVESWAIWCSPYVKNTIILCHELLELTAGEYTSIVRIYKPWVANIDLSSCIIKYGST